MLYVKYIFNYEKKKKMWELFFFVHISAQDVAFAQESSEMGE